MAGRKDRTIVDALEALASVIGQAQQNQQVEGGDNGLDRFLRNKPLTFKGKYNPKGTRVWL